MAGTIYFLADILQPAKARFPAFEVWNLPRVRLPWIRHVAPLPVALTNASLLLHVTVFLSFLYCYITMPHESQRWEVFCFFGLICCSVPSEMTEKSDCHNIKCMMEEVCVEKLLRLIKKKACFTVVTLLCPFCLKCVFTQRHQQRATERPVSSANQI